MKKIILAAFAMVLLVSGCSGSQQRPSGQPVMGVTSGDSGGYVQRRLDNIIPGSEEEFETLLPSRVYFGFDRSDLTTEAVQKLNMQAEWLKKYPSKKAVIAGHADERGTREYNLALGERRAMAVKNYLVSQGVSSSRLKTISYGKDRPAAPGSNEAAWAKNRRAVTDIVN